MTAKTAVSAFGLIIVGDEILDGRREDRHFAKARELLAAAHIRLMYAQVLPDDAAVIEAQLRWAMAREEPFFCCGGIGATPDDLTRDCAARAAGVPLAFHPEGMAILKERFGRDLTPARMRLVEFPRDAALIPNPFNRVPGFTIRNGHFVPGFPEMAGPMMAWVLDTHYAAAEPRARWTILLPGGREGDLVPMMDELVRLHPRVSLSSLPRFTETGGTEVEISISGSPADVTPCREFLAGRLRLDGVAFQERGYFSRTAV